MENKFNVKNLNDHALWKLCLIPEENNMLDNLKQLLKEANEEWSKRKLILVPIMEV